jgi:integrase
VVTAIGAPGLYFHDLRHTGNQLVADTGAGLRDLMARMGHDSARGNVNAYRDHDGPAVRGVQHHGRIKQPLSATRSDTRAGADDRI